MSRSNPAPTSPARKFFAWAGSTGVLQHYDKETKTRIDAKLPFSFMVLDELTTIGGFSDSDKSGIWSNEVRTVEDPLIVRTSAGILATGNYNDLKDQLKARGGKYARSVYIAYQEPDGESFEWAIGNIKLTGAALGGWFDFHRIVDVNKGGVRITGAYEDKKGSNTFQVPVFEHVDMTPADEEVAIELDHQLQAYLTSYLKTKQVDALSAEAADADIISTDVVLEDIEDKPIDLSEIPF